MRLQIEQATRTLANSKPNSLFANNTFLKIILTTILTQDNLTFATENSSGTSLLCNFRLKLLCANGLMTISRSPLGYL